MAGKCENSANFHRRLSHLARNQGLVPINPRRRDVLIPTVRKSARPTFGSARKRFGLRVAVCKHHDTAFPQATRRPSGILNRATRVARPLAHQLSTKNHQPILSATGNRPLTNLLSYPQIYQIQNRILKPMVGLTRFFYFRFFGLPTPISVNNDRLFINFSKTAFSAAPKKLFL